MGVRVEAGHEICKNRCLYREAGAVGQNIYRWFFVGRDRYKLFFFFAMLFSIFVPRDCFSVGISLWAEVGYLALLPFIPSIFSNRAKKSICV